MKGYFFGGPLNHRVIVGAYWPDVYTTTCIVDPTYGKMLAGLPVQDAIYVKTSVEESGHVLYVYDGYVPRDNSETYIPIQERVPEKQWIPSRVRHAPVVKRRFIA